MKTLRVPLVIVLVVLAGRAFHANAQTETNLYSFGNGTDGQNPVAGLVQGSDGNFYGTTQYGGGGGGGTVFRISPSGNYVNLYYLPSESNPTAGLALDSDGNFYGTTTGGGTVGWGTVFQISPSGVYSNLYSFPSYLHDGGWPYAGLVQGSDGNFYGTTEGGGTGTNCESGCGTVFRISPSGSYASLYSFVGYPTDGATPYAGLVQGSDSNFYGTTTVGGMIHITTQNGTYGGGTVFRITSNGNYTNLYSFGSGTDGINPYAGLVQGNDGNFYGTTEYGGNYGNGTVFRISPSGSYMILYFFGSGSDGAYQAGLMQGSDGNFYGTTYRGGIYNYGTVFRISPNGSYTNLYSFGSYPTDGQWPYPGLCRTPTVISTEQLSTVGTTTTARYKTLH